MPLSTEQIQFLLYEIAMSIGNSLDLRVMLKESLNTYLRKLNCSAGGVLELTHTGDDHAFCKAIYSIPKGLPNSELYARGLQCLQQPLTDLAWQTFRSRLPISQCIDDSHVHLMELPDYGLLFIIKKEINLDPFFIKSLKPLNAKLARACLACRQKQEADNAKERAEQASKLKSEFLANMSHEIRTPMNAIINLTDFLKDSHLDEPQQHYVATIQRSNKALLHIINDILDFSKIESGKLHIERHPCSMSTLINNLNAMLQPRAEAKDLDLRTIVNCDVPETFISDPTRLQQCLLNLLSNAIKFTETGHVTLTVQTMQSPSAPLLRFMVQDTGIGIPEDKFDAIFQSFTQADGSTTRKYGGTGLGLAITQSLIERLGGSIQVESSFSEGSIFTLDLPLEYSIPEQRMSPDLREEGSQPTLSGRILVAEDDPVNQMVIRHLLEKLGLTPTLVGHGQEALDQMQTESYDLVVLDVQMPIMNGYEAARRIRALYPDIAIIALTAHAMRDDRQRCLEAGCNDYLSKPIEKQKLIDVLQCYLCKVPS